MIVKEISHKCDIELINALHHVLRREEGPTPQLVGLLQHDLGARHVIVGGERFHRHAGFLVGDLYNNYSINNSNK